MRVDTILIYPIYRMPLSKSPIMKAHALIFFNTENLTLVIFFSKIYFNHLVKEKKFDTLDTYIEQRIYFIYSSI